MSSSKVRSTIAIVMAALATTVAVLPRCAQASLPNSSQADLVTETIYRPDCPEVERDVPKDICGTRM